MVHRHGALEESQGHSIRKGPLKEQNYLLKYSGWEETGRDSRDCLGSELAEESLGHFGLVSGLTEQLECNILGLLDLAECSENSKGSISCS